MIKFSLSCKHNHQFDSWFKSSEAYDNLHKAGMLQCPVCNTNSVGKNIMTPNIMNGEKNALSTDAEQPVDISEPLSKYEKTLQKLRQEIEDKSEYVGKKFVDEARLMHKGETERRSIYGEASTEDASGLIKDGVPVIPLPWPSISSTN